jgi:hypothetical protein
MRMAKRVLSCFALLLAWLGAPQAAEAACTITGVQSMTGATANLGRYYPLTPPVAQVMTINLVLRVSSTGGPCIGTAALMSSAVPATMTGAGTNTLRYDVQSLGGANLLNTTVPMRTIPLSVITVPGQATAAVLIQVQAIAQSGQAVAAGGYSDATVQTHVFDQSNAAMPVAVVANWFVNAAVSPSCKIDGQASANDAAGIRVPVSSGGVVTTDAIQRDYANVVCNAPSEILISSQNGGIKNAAGPSEGFTNVIHYSAQAVFGGATATVNTASSSLAKGVIEATTGASGTMSVTITAQQPAGVTLLNGRYVDVLSVTLTPR